MAQKPSSAAPTNPYAHTELSHAEVKAKHAQAVANLPPIWKDSAFHGLTATQFLGAFNDNLYKQMVLLICVSAAAQRGGGDVFQPIAMAVFAFPFVMFSGFAGFLSDRTSKRTIVILSKVAEIVVMLMAMCAFLLLMLVFPGVPATSDTYLIFLYSLFVVLFFMATQSAFFGPPKYGILPEMFRGRDLPIVNGVIALTTFLAILFGTVLAGILLENLPPHLLWLGSATCVLVAIVGTGTSLLVRSTPIANPGLKFTWSSLAINKDTWNLIRRDSALLWVLLISSWFWMLGGVVQPAVNSYGINQLQVGDTRTSILVLCMALGICVGCPLAGKLSAKKINFRLVSIGAWGITLCTGLLTFADNGWLPMLSVEWQARLLLLGTGLFAGFFSVPLQVFLQARPPENEKGRIIGAMNLFNWIGITASALVYFLVERLITLLQLQPDAMFAATSLLMLPIALFFRPMNQELAD